MTLVKVIHRKIVFVKVGSSVVEISESVHWSRRCNAIIFISVWNEILLGSQGTVNQRTPCQHTISQQNKYSTLERYDRVKIEIKHLYPCFTSEIKYGYSFWLRTVIVFIRTELVPIFYYRDKTLVQMFYFLIKFAIKIKSTLQ